MYNHNIYESTPSRSFRPRILTYRVSFLLNISATKYRIFKPFFSPENWDPYARVEYSNIFEQCLGAEIFKKQNRILKLIISYSYCLIGASKQQNLHQAGPKQALIAPKWLLVGLVTQTNWIDVITNFISIVFKICGSSKSNNLSFDQNHLIKNPILFRKYLSPKNRSKMLLC